MIRNNLFRHGEPPDVSNPATEGGTTVPRGGLAGSTAGAPGGHGSVVVVVVPGFPTIAIWIPGVSQAVVDEFGEDNRKGQQGHAGQNPGVEEDEW